MILKKKHYEAVLVVTHSEIMRIIKGYFENLSDQDMWAVHFGNVDIYEVII